MCMDNDMAKINKIKKKSDSSLMVWEVHNRKGEVKQV